MVLKLRRIDSDARGLHWAGQCVLHGRTCVLIPIKHLQQSWVSSLQREPVPLYEVHDMGKSIEHGEQLMHCCMNINF